MAAGLIAAKQTLDDHESLWTGRRPRPDPIRSSASLIQDGRGQSATEKQRQALPLVPRTHHMVNLCSDCDQCDNDVAGFTAFEDISTMDVCTMKCLDDHRCQYMAYSENSQECKLFPVCKGLYRSPASWALFRKRRSWLASLFDLGLYCCAVFAARWAYFYIHELSIKKRRDEKEKLAVKKSEAAVVIQRIFRGIPARTTARERREAATRIQAAVRRWKAMALLVELKAAEVVRRKKMDYMRERRTSDPAISPIRPSAEPEGLTPALLVQPPELEFPDLQDQSPGDSTPLGEWLSEQGFPAVLAEQFEEEEVHFLEDLLELSDEDIVHVCKCLSLRDRGKFMQLVADLREEQEERDD